MSLKIKLSIIIFRISTMVEKLCKNYGEKICEFNEVTYFSFPDVDKLKQPQVRKRFCFIVLSTLKQEHYKN